MTHTSKRSRDAARAAFGVMLQTQRDRGVFQGLPRDSKRSRLIWASLRRGQYVKSRDGVLR